MNKSRGLYFHWESSQVQMITTPGICVCVCMCVCLCVVSFCYRPSDTAKNIDSPEAARIPQTC